MNPAPESSAPELNAAVRDRYAGTWGETYQREKRGLPAAAYPWVARLRAEKFKPWVKPDDVVLEYGVGHGWNLAALPCRQRLGYEVAAFLADELRAHGIEFVPAITQVPAGSVDVVICHHTLEHVLAPPEALCEMRRLLRLGGTLLLFVPFEKERRYRRYHPAEPNQHLYSWNVQTLGNLVTTAGFDVAEAGSTRFGYDRFSAVWGVNLRLGERGFRFLRALLHTLKPAFEVRLVARLVAPPGGMPSPASAA